VRTRKIAVQIVESTILGVDDHDGADLHPQRSSGGGFAGIPRKILVGASGQRGDPEREE